MDPMNEVATLLLIKLDPEWGNYDFVPPANEGDVRPPKAQSEQTAAWKDEFAALLCAGDQLAGGSPPMATSLRVRTERVVEALYDNPDAAVWAARYVGRYPGYFAELAREKARTEGRGLSKNQLIELEVEWADRFMRDPRLVNRIADELQMPRPFESAFRLELDDIAASRQARGIVDPPAGPSSTTQAAATHAPPPPRTDLLLPTAATLALYIAARLLGRAPKRLKARAEHNAPATPPPPAPDSGEPRSSRGLKFLRLRRAVDSDYVLLRAHGMGLAGVSLSGGGIRSATFSLGVLHALSELDLLRRVDYVSTVSGGGYIGAWLVAWTKRLRGGVREVQQRLCPSRAGHPDSLEQRPLRVLREYSNYLTPRLGVFSADTWTMVAVWFRNTLLNQLVVVLFLAAVIALPRVLGWVGSVVLDDQLTVNATSAAASAAGLQRLATFSWRLPLLLFLVSVGVATWKIGYNLRRFDVPGELAGDTLRARPLGHDDAGVTKWVIAPVAVAGFAGALWIFQLMRDPSLLPAFVDAQPSWGFSQLEKTIGFVTAAVVWVGLVVIQFAGRYDRCILLKRYTWVWGGMVHLRIAAFGLIAAVAGGTLAALIPRFPWPAPTDNSLFWFTITFAPAAFSTALAAAVLLHIGLLGRSFPDERREWWSRLGAHHVRYTIVWVGLFTVSILAPLIVLLAWTKLIPAVMTWIGGTWAGVIAGKGSETSGDAKPSSGSRVKKVAALVGPYIFISGLLLAVSILVYKIVVEASCEGGLCTASFATQVNDWADLSPGSQSPLYVAAIAAGLCLFLSWRVDVNEFSMHHFYKNRLVRCYLGASRDGMERRPNSFTGFDPMDDVKLKEFRPADGYVGPSPIINTALNLTKGEELGWQERKAESFTFTPRFVGYEVEQHRVPDSAIARAGYRPTEHFAYPAGPGIGTATAISGAAANPNMGYHSSPATAFLLTVFNARLGWWVGNTRHRNKWRKQSPGLGLGYLVKELFGRATNRSKFVNISDGGHFENLGLYELVRRRCRYVIAVDGEQDEAMAFGGLANAIRKCRTDFGVHIAIDLSDLHPSGGRSRAHCSLGRIYYPELRDDSTRATQPGGSSAAAARCTGYLLYIKSSLTGDEAADVLEYRARQPLFPHQSTGDQWFDESQFESYRMLGYHVALDALKLAVMTKLQPGSDAPLEALFEYLPNLWVPVLAEQPDDLTKHAEAYSEIFERVRREPQLTTLDPMLYAKYYADPRVADRNQLYIAHSIIDLMHRVFLDLKLDRFGRRPHNEGWMRIFRQWASSPQVKAAWAKVQESYSARFQEFFKMLMKQ